jgi:hypothetical protein
MPQGPADDLERAKSNETSIIGRLKKSFLSTEETVSLLKNLSIVGLLGTVIGSYFQYVSWREEQNIARYKEDFTAATAVFADAADALSRAMNLQQLVYFNFTAAINAGVDGDDDALQTKSGRNIYTSYVDARNSFRQRNDTLAHKLEIYIDWPSNSNRDPTVQKSGDPLNSHLLGDYDFDCDKYLPDYSSITSHPVVASRLGQRKASHHNLPILFRRSSLADIGCKRMGLHESGQPCN